MGFIKKPIDERKPKFNIKIRQAKKSARPMNCFFDGIYFPHWQYMTNNPSATRQGEKFIHPMGIDGIRLVDTKPAPVEGNRQIKIRTSEGVISDMLGKRIFGIILQVAFVN